MASLPIPNLNPVGMNTTTGSSATPASAQTNSNAPNLVVVESSKAAQLGVMMPVSARGGGGNVLFVSDSQQQRKRSNSLAPNANVDSILPPSSSFNSTSNIVINTRMSTGSLNEVYGQEDGTKQAHSSGPLSVTMSHGLRSETGTSRSFSSTRSSLLSSEVLRSFEENIITFVVSLQQNCFFKASSAHNQKSAWSSKKRLSSSFSRFLTWNNVGYALFYLYLMISTLSLSVPYEDRRSYHWGDWGVYIMLVFGFCRTWLMEMVPYVGIIVISGALLLIIAIGSILFYVLYRLSKSGSRYTKTLQAITNVLFVFLTVIHLPSTHILTSFFNCDFNTMTLVRFKPESCQTTTNYVLIILSAITLALQLIITQFGVLFFIDLSPLSDTFSNISNPILIMYLVLTNQIYWIAVQLVPYQFSFVLPIVSILISLIFIIYLFYSVPCFTRWENSIWAGFGFARLGFSIATLLLTTIGTGMRQDDANILGVSIASSSFIFALVLFVIGFSIMEIYTRRVYSSIRDLIALYLVTDDNMNGWKQAPEPHLISSLCQIIDEENKYRNVNLFLRFVMPLGKHSSLVYKHPDFNLALYFVKGSISQKTFHDIDLFISAATLLSNFVQDDINISVFSSTLLNRALKLHPTVIKRYFIHLRIKEMEIRSTQSLGGKKKGTLEMKTILQKLEHKQQKLKHLHKLFWKELMNEIISESKIISINQQIEIVTDECEVLFSTLMINFGSDKSAIRAYAQFLDNFLFQKESAAELFNEASLIEEEESKKAVQSRRPTVKSNRIMPLPTTHADELSEKKVEREDLFDEEIDEDSFGGSSDVIPSSQKKEILFRSALLSREDHKIVYISLLLFVALCVTMLVVGLVINITFSNEISSKVFLVNQACTMNSVSHLIASGIRSLQSTIKYKGINDTGLMISFKAHKDRLIVLQDKAKIVQSLSKSVGIFTTEMKYDFTADSVSLKMPIVAKTQTLEYELKNTSLSETTKLLVTNIDTLLGSTIQQYNLTHESYVFLFFWLNREPLKDAYEKFCVNFIDRNQIVAMERRMIYIILAVCINVIMLLMSALFLVAINIHLRKIFKVVRLFKHIDKDQVGAVFHKLDTNTKDNIQKIDSANFTPMKIILLAILAIVICFFLSSSLIMAEFFLNLDDSYIAMLNVAEATRVLMHSQVVNFGLDEIVFDQNMQPGENDIYFASNKVYLAKSIDAWNNLIYGAAFNGHRSILSENIDSVMSHKNCSATDYSCFGLDQLLDLLSSQADEMNNQAYHRLYSPPILFDRFMQFYSASKIMAYKLYAFIDAYVALHQSPSRVLTGIFATFGFVSLLALTYFTNSQFQQYWGQLNQLRALLCYVNWETLDNNDQLREYALHFQFATKKSTSKKGKFGRLFSLISPVSDNEDEQAFAQVKAVLDSTVEGSIICNVDGSIKFFNQAAQDMFGFRQSEVVGTKISNLFSKKQVIEKIEATIERMKKATTNFGETFEKLKARRKNGKTFPLRANFCVSVINGDNEKTKKLIISCFMKDITTELKHSILIAQEKAKSEALLLNILPLPVANRLKAGEKNIYENIKDVTCLFSDIVGFTSMSSKLEPNQVVEMLNIIVNQFDLLCDRLGLEKIKTIGDAYFLAGGLHNKETDHPEKVLLFACGQFSILYNYNVKRNANLNVRVGIHTGSVTAGVLGSSKFSYDLWGDTVNTASRMESTGIGGRIQISRQTYERVYDLYEFESREVEVKGKGLQTTYLLMQKYHQNPDPQAEAFNADKLLGFELAENQENSNLSKYHLSVEPSEFDASEVEDEEKRE